jgi:hypothetical protein
VVWRETLYAGNRETVRQAFLSRESILLWVITTYHRRRREYPDLFLKPEYNHLTVIELRTSKETEAFIVQLEGSRTVDEATTVSKAG